jgi:hypothetical protein
MKEIIKIIGHICLIGFRILFSTLLSFTQVLLLYLLCNPLPALKYQNVLDLNVAYRAKRTQTYWHIRKFKYPLKKNAAFLPVQ